MFELVVVLTLICMLLVIKIIFDRLDKDKNEDGAAKEVKTSRQPEQIKPREFKGVIVAPGESCCRSVLLLQGKTFTADDKITLPLPECSRKKCDCERKIITERRQRHRRQLADRRMAIRFEPDFSDRRKSGGRRKEDGNTFSGGYRH